MGGLAQAAARDALSRFLDACETPYKKRSLRGSAFLCLGRDGLLNVLYTIPCCGCPGACLGAELGAVSVEAGSGMRPTARVRYSRVLLMCIKLQCISSWCPSALQQERLWNGYEAARAIRALKRPDAKAVPIIALTANAFAEDIQTAIAAGMNAHVAKPIDVAVLQATLGKVLHP